MVEFKSTGVTNEMLSVIYKVTDLSAGDRPLTASENAACGARMDLGEDWNAVTSQVRMYAVQGHICYIIVMDEFVAIYFCFPLDPNLKDEVHNFIFAQPHLDPTMAIIPNSRFENLSCSSYSQLSNGKVLSCATFHTIQISLLSNQTREPIAISCRPQATPKAK